MATADGMAAADGRTGAGGGGDDAGAGMECCRSNGGVSSRDWPMRPDLD
jgi:hypothetical protein